MMFFRPTLTRRNFPRPLRGLCRAALFGVGALMLLAPEATALPGWVTPPEFALSGRAAELEAVVLADTPMGPISALDVAMFDHLAQQTLAGVPIEALLEPDSLKARPHLEKIARVIESMCVCHDLAAACGDWTPREDVLRVASFGAAMAVWIEETARPEVAVREPDVHRYYQAHPEFFFQRRAAQVRYIFRAVGAPAAAQEDDLDRLGPPLPRADADATTHTLDPWALMEAMDRLKDAAERVQRGETTFGDAARALSDAPSGAHGGLVGEFYNGTYHPTFEDRAFALNIPGEMSPVFVGPGGVYLIQLVAQRPPHNVSLRDVSEEIGERLRHEHVRHYFGYLLERAMRRGTRIENHAPYWPYLNRDVPVARVGRARLSRRDFFRFFGNPTDIHYGVNTAMVLGAAQGWTAGEWIVQDLERRGLAQSPWIERARRWAAILQRANRRLDALAPPEAYGEDVDPEIALGASPLFAHEMRRVRLMRIEVSSDALPGDPLPPSVVEMDTRLIEGTVACRPAFDWAAWHAEAQTREGWTTPVLTLQATLAAADWPDDARLEITDLGWRSVAEPIWAERIAATPAGELTAPRIEDARVVRYCVLERRLPSDSPWFEKPLALRTMAFQAARLDLWLDRAQQARRQGPAQFHFKF